MWLTERHDAYIAFMQRVQGMIVAITKAEKEERQKRSTIRTVTLGYDTNKFLKTKVCIRDERSQQIHYEKLEIAPPSTGRHRFTFCQTMYRDIHRFHAQRMWVPANDTHQVSGVTWLELFALSTHEGIVALLASTSSARRKKTERKQEEARRNEGKEKRRCCYHAKLGGGNGEVQSDQPPDLHS